MSALLVALATCRLRVGGVEMQFRRIRSLSRALTRTLALSVIPVLAIGVATGMSPRAGAASTSGGAGPAGRSYSGGMMMAADPTGGYWTVTPAGVVTPHGGAPALGSP